MSDGQGHDPASLAASTRNLLQQQLIAARTRLDRQVDQLMRMNRLSNLLLASVDASSIADAYGMIKVLIQEQNLNEIYIIPNAVKNQAGGQNLFRRINQVCAQFLNYTTKYLGSIENDDQILASHRKFQPVIEFAPESAGSRDFKRLAKTVAQMPPAGDFAGGMQFFVERLVRYQA